MRRIACCLLVAVGASAGCMDAHGLTLFKRTANGAPSATASGSRPRPPVTADEVTETNGHATSRALDEELNREAASGVQPAAATGCPSGH